MFSGVIFPPVNECKIGEDQHKRFTNWEQKLMQISSSLKSQFPDKILEIDALADQTDLTQIYIITPTHTRPTQKAELTRLSQTFMLVPKLHWIVVEDATMHSSLVQNVLVNSGIPHTLLNAKTPDRDKLAQNDPNWLKPRGVQQRNKGIEWIRNTIGPEHGHGVVYFADDDNTYSLKLFKQVSSGAIRETMEPLTLDFRRMYVYQSTQSYYLCDIYTPISYKQYELRFPH